MLAEASWRKTRVWSCFRESIFSIVGTNKTIKVNYFLLGNGCFVRFLSRKSFRRLDNHYVSRLLPVVFDAFLESHCWPEPLRSLPVIAVLFVIRISAELQFTELLVQSRLFSSLYSKLLRLFLIPFSIRFLFRSQSTWNFFLFFPYVHLGIIEHALPVFTVVSLPSRPNIWNCLVSCPVLTKSSFSLMENLPSFRLPQRLSNCWNDH